MTVFSSAAEMQTYLGRLYDQAKCDSRIAPNIRASQLVILFRYRDPDAVVTINASSPPTQPGAMFDVLWHEENVLKSDIEMSMAADVAHQFWQGKINLMAALARKQIVARGPIPKILRLLPAVAPMYDMYPQILRELGREDLVLA